MASLMSQQQQSQPQQQQQQPQVVFYSAPPKNKWLRFPKWTSFSFGIIKIILGAISIGIGIANIALGIPIFGVNIWSGVLVCVTGSFAIPSGLKKNKYMMIAYMVLCIVASVTAGIALIGNCLSLNSFAYECQWYSYGFCSNKDGKYALFAIGILLSLTEMVLCIIGSALCCRAICCCSNNNQQSQIYFGMSPIATAAQQYSIPTNQPVPQQLMAPSPFGMPLSGQVMTSPGQVQIVMAPPAKPQQLMPVTVVATPSSAPNPQAPTPQIPAPAPPTMPQNSFQNEAVATDDSIGNYYENMNVPLVGTDKI